MMAKVAAETERSMKSRAYSAGRSRRRSSRAGLEDVRIHDSRLAFATLALARGESLPKLGKLLGHTQVETTARYAHHERDSVTTSASRFAESTARDILDEYSIGKGVHADSVFPALSLVLEVKLTKEKSSIAGVVDEMNADVFAYTVGYEHINLCCS